MRLDLPTAHTDTVTTLLPDPIRVDKKLARLRAIPAERALRPTARNALPEIPRPIHRPYIARAAAMEGPLLCQLARRDEPGELRLVRLIVGQIGDTVEFAVGGRRAGVDLVSV